VCAREQNGGLGAELLLQGALYGAGFRYLVLLGLQSARKGSVPATVYFSV
jgi:hypothetical protein